MRRLHLWAACGALLVAGSAAQAATTIAQAQAALEAARSNRAVRALAAPELDAAEQALARALAARAAGQARGEIEHLAYLAERRAAIAQMQAKERRIAQALRSLSATHAMISQARALEAAAAARRAAALAQRLTRFDVRPYQQGLLLTPRARWFEVGPAPAPRARPAFAEVAALLRELPEREVLVLGYATRGANLASPPAVDPADLGCVRADVVRAFLISHGVDPRRIATRCLDQAAALETAPGRPEAGEIAIAVLPTQEAAPARLIAGAIAPAR